MKVKNFIIGFTSVLGVSVGLSLLSPKVRKFIKEKASLIGKKKKVGPVVKVVGFGKEDGVVIKDGKVVGTIEHAPEIPLPERSVWENQ